MATAEAVEAVETKPRGHGTNGAAPSGPARGSLWAGLPIEVVVVTGEFSSGKSLLGLTVCPGPETLVFDNEGSTTIYQGLGFHHIDMAAELMQKHPTGYSNEDRYLWWKAEAIRHGKTGKYRVLMVDPFSEIEAGIARYVEKNPTKFGYSDAQFKRSSGLYWAAVKDALKADLDQLRAMYETVVLTVHMRNEFKGATPTGKREPKGKETLHELASLFLLMERKKDTNGNVPAIPSAIVLKSRLAHTKINEAGEVEIVPVLPPRLPQATPQAIRKYIETPPNYSRLKKDERVTEEQMTDDEKLLLQAHIADSNRETSETELKKEELRQRALEQQARMLDLKPQPSDQTASHTEKTEAKASAAVDQGITADQLATLKDMVGPAFGGEMAAFGRWLEEEYGTARVRQLSEDQAIEAIVKCSRIAEAIAVEKGKALLAGNDMIGHKRQAGEKQAEGPAEGPAGGSEASDGGAAAETAETEVATSSEEPVATTIPPGPVAEETEEVPFDADPLASSGHVEKMRALLRESCIMPATFAEMLGRFGKQKIAQLTGVEAIEIIEKLQDRIRRNAEEHAVDADAGSAEQAEQSAAPDNPEEPGSVAKHQMDRLNDLVMQVGWPKDRRDTYLKRLGIQSFHSLSYSQADELAGKLAGTLAKFEAQGIAKN